jgi:cysteine synthase A
MSQPQIVLIGAGHLGSLILKAWIKNKSFPQNKIHVHVQSKKTLLELKKKFPKLKIIAVEPALSPVLSGGAPGPHPIQGIGAGFVPSILDRSVIDEVVTVTKEDAFLFAQRAAREEGFLGGVSTGATLAAIDQVLKNLATHSSHSTLGASLKILGFNYDTGERYLSIEGLFPET